MGWGYQGTPTFHPRYDSKKNYNGGYFRKKELSLIYSKKSLELKFNHEIVWNRNN